MMSSTNRCRLCLKMCQESKSLYDENGSGNFLFDITMNYFHPKIINMNLAKHLTGICFECWKHISDFQSFQTSVMLAQKYLEISDGEDCRSFSTTQLVIKKAVDSELTQLVIKKEAEDSEEKEEENSVQSYILSTNVLQACENSTASDSGQIVLPKLEIMDVKCDNSNDDDDSMSSQSEFLSDTEEEDEGESLLYDASAPANKTDNLEIPSSYQDLNVVKFIKELRRKYYNINMDELIAKHMPPLSCDQCSESFKTFSSFIEHFAQQHPNVVSYFTCFCSAKKWKIIDSKILKIRIKDHFLTHDDPEFFKCPICGSNTYKYKRNLNRHINAEHRTNVCKICDQCFSNKKGLVKHKNSVHKNNQENSMCATVTNGDSMSSQLEFISDSEEDDSPAANKTNKLKISSRNQDLNVVRELVKEFRRKYREVNMDELIAKHMPTISCNQCSETFQTFSSFNEHFAQQHPNVDSYFTCFCSAKKWNINEILKYAIKDHFLLHEDPNYFKCFICDSNAYKYNRCLLYHIQFEHINGSVRQQDDRFACKECGRILASNRNLRRHIEVMHSANVREKIAKCEVCEKTFKNRRNLREHETTHTMKDIYACAFCDKTFKRMTQVVQHRKSVHPFGKYRTFFYHIK